MTGRTEICRSTLTNWFIALLFSSVDFIYLANSGKEKNGKGHFSWLVRFDR